MPVPLSTCLKLRPQMNAGVIAVDRGDLFGRAGGDNLAAVGASFGAEIDNPIGRFHHVQIVFDDDHRIAPVDELIQHQQQLSHVVEMQPGGRLIEQIERSARCRPGPIPLPA